MGTRGDFYIRDTEGRLHWCGSVADDAYDVEEVGKDDDDDRGKSCVELRNVETLEGFIGALKSYFSFRNDVRLPEDGWPWPWDNSLTTDRAYVFDMAQKKARLRAFHWGGKRDDPPPGFDWPDMSGDANVTDGGFIFLMRAE